MLKIGLTGGIGSGKSTVAKLFTDLNAPLIDADIIAQQLVKPGKPALSAITKHFGKEVLMPSGMLNRNLLKEIIFTAPELKKKLETILHPLVYSEIKSQISQLTSPYTIISIPLLIETGMENFVDRILVIDCPLEIQFVRVKKRDQLSDARISSIIASQATREQRTLAADDIIDNSNGTQALAEQVKKLHNLYMDTLTNKLLSNN
jgi:dephospho-CoA kinase